MVFSYRGEVLKYQTIVADPPWRYCTSLPGGPKSRTVRSVVPYPTMTVPELCSLPIGEMAESNAHLYLWTTNTHIESSWEVARAWGFEPSTLLVWTKAPKGLVGFGAYNICTEFVWFCRRGTLPALNRQERNWWEWPRGSHSQKPEAFLDVVEQVSPGPYLELFARRNRLGWDTWGNECHQHVEVSA